MAGPLSTIMIEVMIFAGILIGLGVFVQDLSYKEGIQIDNTSSSGASFLQTVSNTTASMRNATLNARVQNQGWGVVTSVPWALLTGTWTIITGSVTILTDMVTLLVGNFGEQLHFPDWFKNMILGIISLVILAAVISFTLGKDF